MNLQFTRLDQPDVEIANTLNKWDNHPDLIPYIRPNQSREDLQKQWNITVEELNQRMDSHHIYLIYFEGKLVGEMNFMVDPGHLYKKVRGTAWIGITIGDPVARGKGIGYKALRYLEMEIKKQGLTRIELGVFEFNSQAYKLYRQMGYQEIARIPDFTYWNDKMWSDIRMEKVLA
ncbi:GNAT family N-acetyltransferase [Rossellomorea sp. SC111]|uniref:GNAT family N-acetyltransferase n=1 Tax=Rossellomorea sp. SC111 TaxID=2968985 RepID=UPI00215B1F63|nr:GNAT family N-acetyltransferase [Rossellomorea sp. SC111]MCR8847486.1 GNAT family N-acetyltransferase [Rossellomorea sp. SC111]